MNFGSLIRNGHSCKILCLLCSFVLQLLPSRKKLNVFYCLRIPAVVGMGGGINLLSYTCQYVYVCGGGGIQLR